MAKTKKKTKKSSYKCGKCGQSGHNARGCPKQETTRETPAPDAKEEKKEEKVEETQPFVQHIEPSIDLTHRPTREATPEKPGCFECPSCLRAAVLVLVENPDGSHQLKCELCHNKTPAKAILKWGCKPTDKPKTQQSSKGVL